MIELTPSDPPDALASMDSGSGITSGAASRDVRIGKAAVELSIGCGYGHAISPQQAAYVEREMARILEHNVEALRLLANDIAAFSGGEK